MPKSAHLFITSVLVASITLSACVDNTIKANADVQTSSPPELTLYQSTLTSPWQLGIKSHQNNLTLSGTSGELSDGLVKVNAFDKDLQQNALLLNFKDSWSSGVYLTGSSANLTDYASQGILEFDLRIDSIQQGKIDLLMNCEWNCPQVYRLREWAQDNEGKGWQHLAIPLSCLIDNNTDLSKVSQPFMLSTGGKGQLALANVVIKAQGQSNMPCYSPEQLATTPATLNEYWSTDWWLPRHAEKLAQAATGEAKLVMIGDSITHGWENDGKAVWDQHFSDINTLNLGYGGDRTENVLWRLQHGEIAHIKPELVVMMIGTNNTGHRMDSPAAIAAGVSKIVDELTQQLPDSKVLLLAIFPRDAKPDSVARINNQQATVLIEQIAKQRGLLFANFNAAFLTDDGTLTTEMMPDLLHPKAKGYEIWAQQLEPYIDQYVRKAN